jgi:hypothetical protein
MTKALERLINEINMLIKCIQDLYSTNPHDDKKRIEEMKGGLLGDPYYWILRNLDFQKWHSSQWISLL